MLMDLVVAKFGGTSVGNGERIRNAAQSVVNEYMKGNQVVVVVSAVNKTTDELIDLSDSAVGDSLTDKQKEMMQKRIDFLKECWKIK